MGKSGGSTRWKRIFCTLPAIPMDIFHGHWEWKQWEGKTPATGSLGSAPVCRKLGLCPLERRILAQHRLCPVPMAPRTRNGAWSVPGTAPLAGIHTLLPAKQPPDEMGPITVVTVAPSQMAPGSSPAKHQLGEAAPISSSGWIELMGLWVRTVRCFPALDWDIQGDTKGTQHVLGAGA